MAKKKAFTGIDFEQDLARRLRDKEFAELYEQRRMIQEVAIKVKEMREAAGLTQVQLAELIGSKQPAIARLERGQDTRTPQWDVLRRIAHALGRSLRIVFGAPGKEEESELVEVRGKPRKGNPRPTVGA